MCHDNEQHKNKGIFGMMGVKGITALLAIMAFAIALIAAAAPLQQHDVPLENLTPDIVVSPPDTPDRIVLITIDTLRADHLSSYGYPRNTSPFIDSLAKDGILFKRLMASAPLTAPNHASIFTSLYPIQHNVLRNGQKLDSSYLTMAELLRDAGYKTAGFVATNSHFKVGNMDQGFDLLDEPVIKIPARRRTMPHNKTLEADPETPKTRKPLYRQADATVNRAIEWLDLVNQEDKFFLWVHLYDPHTPYYPPERFLEELEKQPEEEKQSFSRFLFDEYRLDFPAFKEDRDDNKIPEIINKYDAEIMFADKEIERLYEHFQDKGLDSNTLWIITADHGEGLGNHNFLGHTAHIYNEQVHIPLIFHFTSGGVKEIVVEQVVEQVDILPTIARLVGTDLSGQTKPVDGTSLLPLMLKDYGNYPLKYAFSHKWVVDKEELPKFMKERYEARVAFRMKLVEERRNKSNQMLWPKRIPRTEDDKKRFRGEKFALQDMDYKYIFNANGTDEFYNLTEDPYEVYNIIDTGSKEENRLRDALMLKVKWLKENASGKPESVDRETIERLKALGYIQ